MFTGSCIGMNEGVTTVTAAILAISNRVTSRQSPKTLKDWLQRRTDVRLVQAIKPSWDAQYLSEAALVASRLGSIDTKIDQSDIHRLLADIEFRGEAGRQIITCRDLTA